MSDYPTVDALLNNEFTVYAKRSSGCWDSAGNPQFYYEIAAMLKQIEAQEELLASRHEVENLHRWKIAKQEEREEMSDYPTVDVFVREGCFTVFGNWSQLYSEVTAMQKQIEAQKEQIARLKQTLDKSNRQVREERTMRLSKVKLALESPQERCRRTRSSNCHFCDSVDCCDNSSPLKKQVIDRGVINLLREKRITDLEEQIKQLRTRNEELYETLKWAGLGVP